MKAQRYYTFDLKYNFYEKELQNNSNKTNAACYGKQHYFKKNLC